MVFQEENKIKGYRKVRLLAGRPGLKDGLDLLQELVVFYRFFNEFFDRQPGVIPVIVGKCAGVNPFFIDCRKHDDRDRRRRRVVLDLPGNIKAGAGILGENNIQNHQVGLAGDKILNDVILVILSRNLVAVGLEHDAHGLDDIPVVINNIYFFHWFDLV